MDGILTALLALCAMMVVFSTIVTVMQEALHKGLQSRRNGMMSLMESLYMKSVAPRLRNQNLLIARENSDKAGARRFALDMTANSTVVMNAEQRKLSELPVLRLHFGDRLERMNTNEFAEQLARSEVGKIVGRQENEALKETLRGFAYDFERFGDAQLAMFKKKAKFSAVLMGVLVALLLNVDVIHTFRTLVKDQNTAARLAQTVIASGEGGQNALQSAESANLQALASDYEGLGLPIGAQYFPFCARAIPEAKPVDERCKQGDGQGSFGMVKFNGIIPDYDGTQLNTLTSRLSNPNSGSLLWVLSVLFAGAAFGMGAPFWFNLFRKLGATTAGGKVVNIAGLDSVSQPGASVQPLAIRSDAATPDALVYAFRTVQDAEA